MTLDVKQWKDWPDLSTPISGASLTDMEQRVSDEIDVSSATLELYTRRGVVPVNASDHLDGVVSETVALTNAWTKAMAENRPLYIPTGDWDFNGPALTTTNVNIYVFGDGRYKTNINLAAGIRLFDIAVGINTLHIHDFATSGGLGVFRSTFSGAAQTVHKIVERCHFENYTGCCWETNASDDPYWEFKNCRFRGLDFTATMGLALGGGGGQRLLDHLLIDNCDFIRNRYDVKITAGGNVHIRESSFLRFSGASPGERAYIWCIPDTDLTNPGIGMLVTGCKFGSEGALAGDHVVLYADEDAASGTSWGTRLPQLAADSTGVIIGHTFRDNNYNGAVGTARPLFYSTTPHIRGCSYSGVIEAISGITYLFQFRTTPTQDERNISSTLGPFLSHDVGVSSPTGSELLPKITNAPGTFFFSDPTGQWSGRVEAPAAFPGGSNSAEYVRLLSTLINNFTAVNSPTKSVVTDAMGGQDAAEIAFTTVSDSYFASCVGAVAGKPMWVEFDVKTAAGGTPLTYFYVKVRHGGTGFSHLVRIVEIDSTWRTVRLLVPSLRSVASQPAIFFSTSGVGTVQVGRVRAYHAREPIAPDLIPDMPAVVAANTIQLPPEGRAFAVSGATTINHLAKSYPGRMVLLHFSGAPTVTHNAGAPPTGYAPILINGAANFVASANDVLALLYNGTSWVGISPGSAN
jgi:hypothetical protein